MKLTVLGYLGGYPAAGIGTSAYLVESGDFRLLMDCGSGALLALEKVADPFSLDAVLLTHYHHDHAADIGVLQYYEQLHSGTPKVAPLPIYGHTKDPLNFAALTFGDFTTGVGYTADSNLTLGPLSLTFLETQHPVPAFAVRITETATGKTLVNTSDTRAFAGLAPFAQGADWLMADTNFLADHSGPTWHLTAPQAGELAKAAGVPHLLLTHLPQELDLATLHQQAQVAAGAGVQVALAKQNLVITL